MANGRFEKNPQRRAGHYKRKLALLLSLILLVSVAVSGTLAYLLMGTESVTDTFTPAEVKCEVTVSGNTYTIKNTGNIPAYIRAVVVVNKISENGVEFVPTNDAEVTITANGMTLSGDVYKSGVVAVDGTVSLSVTDANGFNVQVLAEAIQSIPDDAKTDAWGS